MKITVNRVPLADVTDLITEPSLIPDGTEYLWAVMGTGWTEPQLYVTEEDARDAARIEAQEQARCPR